DRKVALCISIAALAALPCVFGAGPLIDWAGRRLGAAIIFGLTALGVFGAYTLHGAFLLTVMLVLGIFGASAVLSVLYAYTVELFPTELRGAAFAWSNNLIGRVGYVLSPIAVGAAAGQWGWGLAVRGTALFPILALILILWLLPETKAMELEETSRL